MKGTYLGEEELKETLQDAFESALDQAALGAFEGIYEAEQLGLMVKREDIITTAMDLILERICERAIALANHLLQETLAKGVARIEFQRDRIFSTTVKQPTVPEKPKSRGNHKELAAESALAPQVQP